MSKDFYYQAARDQYEVLQAAQHRTLATLEECRVEGIKDELVVGITGEMKQAIEVVCSFQGLKPQQFGRLAILEKLVATNATDHPGQKML